MVIVGSVFVVCARDGGRRVARAARARTAAVTVVFAWRIKLRIWLPLMGFAGSECSALGMR